MSDTEKDAGLPEEAPVDDEAASKALPSSVWKRFIVGSSNAPAENETKRAMQSRHLMMIAIGGTIGTGIFLSAGSAIALAGPGSALLSYVVVGMFVYSVVIALGEMSAMFPVSGAFSVFGSRFVSPALGFTLGWNYWFQWYFYFQDKLQVH